MNFWTDLFQVRLKDSSLASLIKLIHLGDSWARLRCLKKI